MTEIEEYANGKENLAKQMAFLAELVEKKKRAKENYAEARVELKRHRELIRQTKIGLREMRKKIKAVLSSTSV